jgi:hypothetical protein
MIFERPLLDSMQLPPNSLDVGQSLDSIYGELRVVALRLDPCFHLTTAAGCQAQIRLVLQPLVSKDGHLVARDIAVHTFYALAADEFASIAKGVTQLKASSTTSSAGPLRVHPIIAAEGLSGSFASGISHIIQTYAGKSNLVRAAFSASNIKRDEWSFSAVDIAGQQATAHRILDSQATTQTFKNFASGDAPESSFSAGSFNPPIGTNNDVSIFLDSANALGESVTNINSAYSALVHIQSPVRSDANSIACAPCHVASSMRGWADTHLSIAPAARADLFTSTRDLSLVSTVAKNTNNVRAFGYFDDQPAFSERTVNETAATLDAIERDVLGH